MIGYSGLSLQDYVKGEKPPEGVIDNALDLLGRVEGLLLDLGWDGDVVITSGYRSPVKNKAVGGKPKSWHMQGRAVDLRDASGELYNLIEARAALLAKHGLWMEQYTRGWVHLDTGIRRARPIRIFLA